MNDKEAAGPTSPAFLFLAALKDPRNRTSLQLRASYVHSAERSSSPWWRV